MPGRFYLTEPLARVAAAFGTRVELDDPGPRIDAAPGEQVAAVVDDDGRVLREMRWGMVMSGRVNARGRPVMETVVNARSETVFEKSAFAGVRRAALPVSGWYEWTGARRRKTRWRIFAPERKLLVLAAIYDVWRGPGGVEVPQLATLTVAPNADVEAYHHRMPAILDDGELEIWLAGGDAAAAEMLAPAPVGLLRIEAAEDVQKARGH